MDFTTLMMKNQTRLTIIMRKSQEMETATAVHVTEIQR